MQLLFRQRVGGEWLPGRPHGAAAHIMPPVRTIKKKKGEREKKGRTGFSLEGGSSRKRRRTSLRRGRRGVKRGYTTQEDRFI